MLWQGFCKEVRDCKRKSIHSCLTTAASAWCCSCPPWLLSLRTERSCDCISLSSWVCSEQRAVTVNHRSVLCSCSSHWGGGLRRLPVVCWGLSQLLVKNLGGSRHCQDPLRPVCACDFSQQQTLKVSVFLWPTREVWAKGFDHTSFFLSILGARGKCNDIILELRA